MKQKTYEELQMFLSRLQQRDDAEPEIIDRLREEYRYRLNAAGSSRFSEEACYEVTLSLLTRMLAEILEELELRQFSGEFEADDIKQELAKRSLSKPATEMLKMMASLDAYRETIDTLTGGTLAGHRRASVGNTFPESEDEPVKMDIDRVLSEFESINLFADFKEGDAVYDSQYQEEDRQVLNQLFFDILDGYLEPLVVGFKAVMGGNNSLKLFSALLASIRPLRHSAETMGFADLMTAFVSLENILVQAQETGNMISADRIQFVRAYTELTHNLPEAGKSMGLVELFDSDTTNDSMILKLIRSSGVEGWMIQALLEVGITDLKKLLSTTPDEMRSITGLPVEQCRDLLNVCRREIHRMN